MALRLPLALRCGLLRPVPALSRQFCAAPSSNAEASRPASGVVLEAKGDGVAHLTLRKGPVNAMDLDLLKDICEAHAAAVADPEIRGLVVKSDSPRVFSAGLDLAALSKMERAEMAQFWKTGVQELFLALYGSPLVTVAAVGGHAPAGGCFLALLCDARVLARGARIGLSETTLGISAPFYFFDAMKGVVGWREAERGMQLGKLYEAEEALRMGLVDAVAEDKAATEAAAEAELRRWLEVPDHGRRRTKLMVRKTVLDEFRAARPDDVEVFCDQLESEAVQRSLAAYIEILKQRQK